ncbi:MAG: peptidoglycan DD-metalloendopeptidase family protein [Gammaproteobacteria bacterium]|nr:peptidoglycan DD-metalloendopeptidase family protein [Gammaproteobacteria bacterium]
MTTEHDSPQQQAYPKKHLIAASGVAAMVSMVLVVFPSKQVEANRAVPESPAALHARAGKPVALEIPSANPATQPVGKSEPVISVHSQPETVADIPEVEPRPLTRLVTVESGDTLSAIFGRLELGHSLLMSILDQDKNARQLTNLKLGQELLFTFDEQGQLDSISSQLSPLESVELTRNPETGRYSFAKHTRQTTQVETTVSGTIENSLLGATHAAGMPYSLALDMANVFAYDIDFARDLRTGDRFEVVYEQKMLDDQIVGTGNILAARFTNKGKTLTAVRYVDKNGQRSYYNSDGTSSRRAFIRTPVDFSRISSKFNPGRKHPVLNKIRAHRGVDYAAPTGTPIKATGNGKIAFVGNKNGYGKTIIIQHGGKYRTLYAHMSNYAKGMQNGSTVSQGQVIGYVGMTGLATGPHLHYEFHVNGTHVDPLSHKLPTADPIPKSEMARFKQATQPYVAMLDQARATQVARAETVEE